MFSVLFSVLLLHLFHLKKLYMVAGIELVTKFSQTEVAKELGDNGISIVKDITYIIHGYAHDSYDRDRRR